MNIFEDENEENFTNSEENISSEEEQMPENPDYEQSFNLNNLASDDKQDYSNVVNLDKLQEIIQSFDNEQGNGETTQIQTFDFIDQEAFIEQTQEAYLKANENNFNKDDIDLQKAKSKKFVIQIQPKNIEYFNNLSIDSRNQIINQILAKKQREIFENKMKKFLIHFFIIFFTITLFLPLCFWLAKTSIKSSLDSSKQVQNSFETLYKVRGGIKHKQLKNLKNVNF